MIGMLLILEWVIKLIALGPVGYYRDKWNLFDGTIAMVSIYELVFLSGGN